MARRVDQEDPDDNDVHSSAHLTVPQEPCVLHPPAVSDKDPPPPPATNRLSLLMSRNLVFGFLAFGVLVLVGSLAFTIVASKRANADPDEELMVVRRSDWKAAPPVSVSLVKTPAQFVVVGQTETEGCSTHAQCTAAVRALQQRDLRSGFSDIAHNFLVGGDGAVLEGRGWGVQCPLQRVRAAPSLVASLVGTYTWLPPSVAQLDALRRLIRVGVRYGYIADNYTLLADFEQKPGYTLVEELSTWPHWSAGL